MCGEWDGVCVWGIGVGVVCRDGKHEGVGTDIGAPPEWAEV